MSSQFIVIISNDFGINWYANSAVHVPIIELKCYPLNHESPQLCNTGNDA